MLSLINKGIEPTGTLSDPVTYMTSIHHLQSISGDSGTAVEKIKDLLSTPKTKLHGLLLLKIALEQNSDVYVKGNWPVLLIEIITGVQWTRIPEIIRKFNGPGKSESEVHILKEHACEVFCALLPYMAKDAATNILDFKKFSREVFPYLLSQIDENTMWSKAALKLIYACLKFFPQPFVQHRDQLLSIILTKVTHSVSSEMFELIADCFCELPNLVKGLTPTAYLEEWKKQYLTVLNTVQQILNNFITFLSNEDFADAIVKIDAGMYFFNDYDDDSSKDVHRAYMKGARRYINLSKCLAKMLSSQSRFAVEIPLKMTLITASRLFQVQDLKNIKPSSVELQIFCSVLSQMQMASLIVLEAVMLNFNVLPYSSIIAEMMQSALVASKLTNISFETVSQIRHAVWKFLKTFIKKYGSKVAGDILNLQNSIFEELLADISIQEKNSSQASTSPKSKKNAAILGKRRFLNADLRKVCIEALETLEQLLYTGSPYFTRKVFQEVFSKILQIACSLQTSTEQFPFPYDDESCRKNLYSVLLALTVISNLDQSDLAQCAIGLLKNAFRDPSSEVTGFCNIAVMLLGAKIHPKRPLPKYPVHEDKQRPAKVSSAMVKCPDWSSDDFVPNLPLENVSEDHENITPRTARTFHDSSECAMLQEEPMEEDMEAEPHYSERYVAECYIPKYSDQGDENHNGDDILEIQHSNQCQEEVESDDDEEEEEDDDDERSYGEEEIQQVDISSESMYIPSTSKLQVGNPVHMNPDSVTQNLSEYELRSCVKTETADNSKNVHLNGARNIVPDADVPSSSTRPSLVNENGVFVYEEEEFEEEEGEEDEEDESVSFPAEKRVPGFYPPNPPNKKQKIDNDEPKIEPQADEDPSSPTLTEMKADFCCNEIDDIKS